MRTIFIALLLALAANLPARAIDTSVGSGKRSDLTAFGKWLYAQPNTDADLCVQFQDSLAGSDSATVLAEIVSQTVPRRTAWLTKQVSAGTKSGDRKAITPEDRLRYAGTEIAALKDSCSIREIAGMSSSEITAYRKAALIAIDLAINRRFAAAEVQGEADRLRPYLNLEPDAALAQEVVQLQSEVSQLQNTSAEHTTEIAALHSQHDALAEVVNRHISTPIKRAHPQKEVKQTSSSEAPPTTNVNSNSNSSTSSTTGIIQIPTP